MSGPSKAAREAVLGLVGNVRLCNSLWPREDVDALAAIIDEAMRPEREAAEALAGVAERFVPKDCVSTVVRQAFYRGQEHHERVTENEFPECERELHALDLELITVLAAYRAATGEK